MATETLLGFFSPLPSPSHKPLPAAAPTSIASLPSAEEQLALCLLSLSAGDCYLRQRTSLLHRCCICGKSFSSYQALGGHKSSHRRTEKVASEACVAPAPAPTCNGSGSEGAHQCTLCLRRFPTGQALGGHKRLHYWGSIAPSSSLSVKLREFDLNLPPSLTAEEVEEVQIPVPRKKIRLLSLM